MKFSYIHSYLAKNPRSINCPLHISTKFHIFYFVTGSNGSFFLGGNHEEIISYRLFYIVPGTAYGIQCNDPDTHCFHVSFELKTKPFGMWEKSLFTVPPKNSRKDLYNLLVNTSIACLVNNLESAELHISKVFETIDFSNHFLSVDLAIRHYGASLRNIPRHNHFYDFQIEYFDRGKGLLLYGEKWIPIKNGLFCLIPPNVPHEIIFCPDSNTDNYSIKCKIVNQDLSSFPPEGYSLLVPESFQLPILNVMKNIVGEYTLGRQIDREQADRLFSLLNKFSSLIAPAENTSEAVLNAVEYIEDNFSDKNLRLSNISAHVGLSNEHLSRIFHDQIGDTVTAYITKMRVEHGVMLLKDSDYPIKQIAHDCGFSSSNYFSLSIKKHYSLTPKEIRTSCSRILNHKG